MLRNGVPNEVYHDWFNLGKPLQRIEIASHESNKAEQNSLAKSGPENDTTGFGIRRAGFNGQGYVEDYKDKDVAKALKHESRTGGAGAAHPPYSEIDGEDDNFDIDDVDVGGMQLCGRMSRLSDLDGTTAATDMFDLEETTRYYQKFNFSYRAGTNCSIIKHKDTILHDIEMNPVVVIKASTGSGKTTQVPQFILDRHVARNSHCNIMVTQPRRIAAMSIARRVCKERGWPLGSVVGYQVGLDNVTSPDTRLAYVTTGVLLQKLVMAKNLREYTHIILDEVHERDMDMDLLMLLVRKLARHVSRDTKIILMSATFDADMFADYFSMAVGGVMQRAKINVFKEKSYRVSVYYIEALQALGPLPAFDYSRPSISPEAIHICKRLITQFDKLETSEQKCEENEFAPIRHTVLVFLPGIDEIHRLYRALDADIGAKKWTLIPLHSMISGEDQRKAFDDPQSGFRKIILATNIAESSITVPDIKYVVDFCLTKNQVCDPFTNYSSLELEWASKSNCCQRKGRAGRCDIGRTYRMVTEEFYDSFAEFGTPEMKRCALDKVVLHLKLLDMGEPKSILALAMDPPELQDIERTILTLMEVGALTARWTNKGITSALDGDLTFLGRVVSNLPIDVHLGKLVVLGHAFGCLEECIIMAAGLSHKSIFTRPYTGQLEAYSLKLSWADGSFSDCIAILNVYTIWRSYKDTNYFSRPGSIPEKEWGLRFFVQVPRLNEVHRLVEELTKRLCDLEIRVPRQRPKFTAVAERNLLLKLVLAGAFYPHYFTQAKLDEAVVAREVAGYNMYNTVVIGGLPLGQSVLYSDDIEQGLRDCGHLEITHFEHSTSRAYVGFSRTKIGTSSPCAKEGGGTVETKIVPAVYLAIKKRLLRQPIEITLYSPEEATERLRLQEATSTGRSSRGSFVGSVQIVKHTESQLNTVELPDLSMTSVELRVGHFVDCGHFWAQYGDTEHQRQIVLIKRFIDRNLECGHRLVENLLPSMLVLAPYTDASTTQYYRAIVEKVRSNSVEVFFVDYGNTETVSREELRAIDKEHCPILVKHPKQAFECYLANFKPCPNKCPDGLWSRPAKNHFQKALDGIIFIGRIYSVVHEVVRLEVIYKPDKRTQTSLNDEMKQNGFADNAEEDFLSKQNNSLRCRARLDDRELGEFRASEMTFWETNKKKYKGQRYGKTVQLKGPSSPLEMAFEGLSRGTSSMAIRIEPDSVNSVSLDPEPQDKLARLIVASDFNISPSGTAITARSTTFFPNIHGLVHIVTLIFSPKVEFRTDMDKTCYTGALCGLGYHYESESSIYPEHEIELCFDVKFDITDIDKLNHIRLGLNLILRCLDDPRESARSRLFELQERVQRDLLNLVRLPREAVENPRLYRHPYKWRQADEREYMVVEMDRADPETLTVLPMLRAIRLRNPNDVYREKMLIHLKELHLRASASEDYAEIFCRLCNVHLDRPRRLLLHLDSKSHRELQLKLTGKVASN